MKFNKVALVAAMAFMANSAWAGCGIEKGSVRILSNDFAAMHVISSGAKACADSGVTVTTNMTTEHRDIQVAALKANPAVYTSAVVANGSIVPLLNENLIRPLDDLVAKYGKSLKKNQLITIDGKTVAVAFMANAQRLFYRKDILDKAGVAVPKSYEDVLAAAKIIREKGLMEFPYMANFKVGWNLGEEFVNMYLGMEGEFFKPGTAEVSVNNAKGVAALNMLKSLTEYTNPDFLTFDSNATSANWESGQVALMVNWGSRANGILDNEGSSEEVVANTMVDAAPTVGGGSTPATALWWDGFAIAKNISDEDAEASFVAMVNGISPEVVKANNDIAVWLVDGFVPNKSSNGVFNSAKGGAKPYSLAPFMGLLHNALGSEIVDFLQGKESAEKALADVEAAYNASAKEKGFL
jgi:ABC-type glycerol-3-phosphate transport system substrate-binding protein